MRVRVGASLIFAASPAHIQGHARPPSLPSPRGGRGGSPRRKDSPLPPLFPPPLGEGEGGGQPGICCFTCSYSGPCPAPIPAFPQRGKERRPEGAEQRWAGGRSTLTLTLSRKREREQEIPPPLGEGEGGGQPGFAASPAHIQGSARPPSLPSPKGDGVKARGWSGSSFFSFLSAKACKIGCWISLQINNDKKPAGGLHRQLR